MGLGLSMADSLDSLSGEAEEDLMMQLMEEGAAVVPRIEVESSPRALGVEEESGKWKADDWRAGRLLPLPRGFSLENETVGPFSSGSKKTSLSSMIAFSVYACVGLMLAWWP